ncbi:MAG: arsenic resistance protein [Mariniphaga sp.]
MATGLLAGQIAGIGKYAEIVIVPFLMLMLFGLFLNIPVKELLKSFSNLKFSITSVVINFIWTPLFAYALGALFLQNEQNLWIGFVMLLVTPCTDWYLIFTGTARGNMPLSASVLPLNLILQIVLLPVYLLLFFGKSGTVDTASLFESIILVLLVPFVLAQAIKYTAEKINRTTVVEKQWLPFFENSQVIFLGLAIAAMFASQGEYLTSNAEVVLILLLPLLLFFVINFLLGRITSVALHFTYEDSASLNLTTLARNSPVALAIAVTAFPGEPLIALALVIGPLIELPVLAIVSQLLLQIRKRKIS